MPDAKAIRRYQASVERALGLFDATNEWADYIAFLSRLLKALQAAPDDADVPSKTTLARYLAQCLRPSLPAGVHQKALEVYALIFTLLGKDGLSRDLALYLPGISNTLSFASLATKPWFLSLHDDHILKLPSSVLRPALKAIILSLLPGIEEENSEDFDKTLATLNRVRASFTTDQTEHIFWQCLFLASITSPNRRMGVLMYLNRYLPNLSQGQGPSHDSSLVEMMVTPEPGLLIRCFATGLEDDQPLIQRGFLDLLVGSLPLKATTLQRPETADDLDILTSCAMTIVLRRDMSLNRRLWAWFLGSDEKGQLTEQVIRPPNEMSHSSRDPEHGQILNTAGASDYLSKYGLPSMIRTFQKMLARTSTTPAQRARPFRILISLMDRASIGLPIVEAMFQPLLQDLKNYQMNAPSQEAFDEVFRSANVFFDSVETRVIARKLLHLVKMGNLDLVDFIVSNFNLEDDVSSAQHIPAIACVLSEELLKTAQVDQSPAIYNSQNQEQFARVLSLLVSVPPNLSDQDIRSDSTVDLQISSSIYGFYASSASQSPKQSLPPMVVLMRITLNNICSTMVACLRSLSSGTTMSYLTVLFEKLWPALVNVSSIPESQVQEFSSWASEFLRSRPVPFGTLLNYMTVITTILATDLDDNSPASHNAQTLIPPVVEDLWRRLGPSTPQCHVESVEAVWALRSLSYRSYLVDSTIMSLLGECKSEPILEQHPIFKFATLWTHTKLPIAPGAKLTNGEQNLSENDPVLFLEAAALYVLDLTSVDNSGDPGRMWMGSLQSLHLHFQAALRGFRDIDTDPARVSIGIERISKLVKLSKTSPTLWKDFTASEGQLGPVLSLITSMAISKQQNPNWVRDFLHLLQLIHDGSDNLLNPTLIDTLTQQIPKNQDDSEEQKCILDTLQVLITLPTNLDPPPDLLAILMRGIASPTVDSTIDKWITLLCNSIPLYPDSILFKNLLKLTECFCRRIQTYFNSLKAIYEDEFTNQTSAGNPERSITNLLSGLEYILARAHTKVAEALRPSSTSQDTPNDPIQPRALANNRLTAILSMQDAIKICGQVWYWRSQRKSSPSSTDSKSFSYMSSRLRARSRRMLEHLINAEPQECLETLMGMWVEAVKKTSSQAAVMNLLESLEGARPRFMMPAIFNAIYGRTNPSALELEQKSSLSIDVTALELVAFLTDYVGALEDDLLEEIWGDCTSFMRDILANPMPHRQILLRLLEFLAILCQKMENTSFGDQVRMRRELADLCARLFTAIFTIKPGGFDQSASTVSSTEKVSPQIKRFTTSHGIEILCHVLPNMSPVLSEGDRISSIYGGIAANITGPLLRSRNFPTNISTDVLQLLSIMSKAQSALKVWRKDVFEAFNDSKLFQASAAVAESGWAPIVKQLAVLDKGVLPEVISKIAAPATAGIMFGVGAQAARMEADKQTRFALRRIALLMVSNENDAFVSNSAMIIVKIEDLLTANPATSPSSATRGDVFLLLRTMCLTISQNNLISLWPVLDSELRAVFEDISKNESDSAYSRYSYLQAAKLLDLLLLLKPEEFQLHEWLYITDTIDAIYPPAGFQHTAMADTLSLAGSSGTELQSTSVDGRRKPWLCTDESRVQSDVLSILGSFFGHLSIRAFEDTYSLEQVDLKACKRDLIADLFTAEE